MNELFLIFIAITVLFAVLLIVQSLTKWRFCALCGGVFAVWLGLVALYWAGQFQNIILAAPLLGASVVGIYYLAERKAKEGLRVFRLPFFLTLLFAAYLLLDVSWRYLEIIFFLAVLWLFFGAVYVCRKNPKVGKLAKRIIECCKNW